MVYEADLFPRSVEADQDSLNVLETLFVDDVPKGLVEMFDSGHPIADSNPWNVQ